jgi:hypothetical protein
MRLRNSPSPQKWGKKNALSILGQHKLTQKAMSDSKAWSYFSVVS